MKQIIHPLTKAQNDYLQPLVNEVGRLRRQIQQFLNYAGAEAGLPEPEKGWDLKLDGPQAASLVGAFEAEEGKKQGKEN